MAPRVPLHVESLEALQGRYAAAIKDLINHTDATSEGFMIPSSQRHHVFDTESGWRLIISRERLFDGTVGIHFSASIHDPNKMKQLQLTWYTKSSPYDALDEVVRTWREISKTCRTPTLIAVSEGGIPHFFVEQLQ